MDTTTLKQRRHQAYMLSNKLKDVGHPGANVAIYDLDGEPLCRVDGLELTPEQVVTLARALKLIGYSNKKTFQALGALRAFAQ